MGITTFLEVAASASATSDCISPERAGTGPAPVARCVGKSSQVSLDS